VERQARRRMKLSDVAASSHFPIGGVRAAYGRKAGRLSSNGRLSTVTLRNPAARPRGWMGSASTAPNLRVTEGMRRSRCAA